jgi:energy-coupling factor transporter ATP-binding protein EcfA2
VQRTRQITATSGSDFGLPLVGLQRERRRTTEALRRRESLLVLGPRGCGKTKVISTILENESGTRGIVYVVFPPTMHELLVSLARALIATGHGALTGLSGAGTDLQKWCSKQTSVHLRGLLWTALEAEPRILILDGIENASFQPYRFLQRLYHAPGMAIVAVARSPFSLGALGRLFWDPRQTANFQPLSEQESAELFEAAADRFRLRRLDLDEFREKVLESAHGNPGEIVEMCRLAADPQYESGRYIKFAPLRIDALMNLGH